MRSDLRVALVGTAIALLTSCARPVDRMVVVSTDDVQGKTSPCGCHTPKGGLARRATFLDSVRTKQRAVLVVDAGNFFPADEDERDAGPFMLAAMAKLGTRVAGVGANDLRFGYSYLQQHARAVGLPLVSANLVRFDTNVPAFEGWHVETVRGVKVGVFGLIAEDTDLGPARDTLRVDSPVPAAQKAVAALRAQGVGVIVALSQLGKAGSDSLAVQVSGIDVIVAGGGTPALMDGVRIGRTMVLHGGNQGWQVGVADVRLTREGRAAAIEGSTVILGPEVRTQPEMAARVKTFEDSLNAHLKARDAALGAAPRPGATVPHFVGMANCVKCHAAEYAQWQTTAHARGWKTLADQQKESTPACVPCHVTGFKQPGGFRTADDAARFGNVQCEACHGMGTSHREWNDNGAPPVAESVCRTCHTPTTSPTFSFATYRPHVLHQPPPGLKPLPETPAQKLMRQGLPPHGK